MNSVKYWSAMTVVISVILLVLCCIEADSFPRGVNWRQIQTKHFTIVFLEEHRDIAKNVAGMAEAVHNDMLRFLNYEKQKRTYVVMTDHIDTLDRLTVPVAQQSSRHRIVLLLGDVLSSAPSFDLPSQQWLSMQFIYQYTFIMRHRMDRTMRTILSTIIPDAGFSGWMDGGMSLYMTMLLEGQLRRSPYFDMLMRSELLEDRFESLQQQSAAGSQEWPGDVSLFLYGYSFLLYLSETYGTDLLTQLNATQNHTLPQPLSTNKAFNTLYGKPFKELQQDWYEDLTQYYHSQIQAIHSQSLTLTKPLSESGYFTGYPAFSPDGHYIYYIEDSPHRDQALIQLRLADQHKTRLDEGNFSGSLSISSDGQRIYFCKTDYVNIYYQFSDLYMYDLPTQKVTRLTKGTRAFDPEISPDGRSLVYVASHAGTMLLKKLHLSTGQHSTLYGHSDSGQQIHFPRFSPDGEHLAFQVLRGGERGDDIYLMDSDGTNLQVLFSDDALDTAPVWGRENDFLFFSSNRSGVPNIFAYSFQEKRLFQVTNVVTGAFHPTVSPVGHEIVFTRYSSRGFDIHLMVPGSEPWKPIVDEATTRPPAIERLQEASVSEETGYRSLSPVFSSWPLILPNIGTDEAGYQLGLYFSGSDILKQHEYSLQTLYGFESGRFKLDGEYRYNRFNTKIGFFGYDRAEKYAQLYLTPHKDDDDFWERQQGGGVTIGFPFYKSRKSELLATLEYEYRKISNLSKDLVEVEIPEPDTGALSNVAVRLVFDRSSQHRYSVSPESGVYTSIEYKHYNEALGGDYNVDSISGDLKLYINSFFRHHVLTLRTAGGYGNGDDLEQGIFQLGGYFFQVQSNVLSRTKFFLRGYADRTFRGDRFVLGSADYRLPLWYVQHSWLNGLLRWNSIAATAFFDAGDAWIDEARDVELNYSAGGEINFKVGYWYGKVPLDFDIGVAHGFDQEYGTTQVYFRMRVNTFSY